MLNNLNMVMTGIVGLCGTTMTVVGASVPITPSTPIAIGFVAGGLVITCAMVWRASAANSAQKVLEKKVADIEAEIKHCAVDRVLLHEQVNELKHNANRT